MYKFLIFVAVASVASGSLVRTPIYKNEKYTGSSEQLDAEKEVFIGKHILKKTGSSVYENVESAFHNRHYGVVSVGTPPQNLTVVFDTSNAQLWFFENNTCLDATSAETNCPKIYGFDPSKSISFNYGDISELYYYYDNEPVSGLTGYDTLRISNLTVIRQGFTICNIVYTQMQYWNNMQGHFGLSLNAYYSAVITAPVKSIVQRKLLQKPVISLYFLSDSQDGIMSQAGEVIFGGSDPSLYKGTLSYTNITNMGFWQFNATSISFGLNQLCTNCSTSIDSTTPYMSAPKAAYNTLNSLFNATVNGTTVTVDCSTLSTLSDLAIEISGTVFTLPASALLQKQTSEDETTCTSLIMQSSDDTWIVSEAFLSRYYTTLDFANEIIGFAPIKNSNSYKPPQSRKSCKSNLM